MLCGCGLERSSKLRQNISPLGLQCRPKDRNSAMYLLNTLLLLLCLLLTVSPISAQPVRHTGLHSLHQHHAHRRHRSWYEIARAISQLQKPVKDANPEIPLQSRLNDSDVLHSPMDTPSAENSESNPENSSSNDT